MSCVPKAGSWEAFTDIPERSLCAGVGIGQCCDLSTAGQNVGAASHSQDRGWEQLRCFYSGEALLCGPGTWVSGVPLNLSVHDVQQLQSWGWFRF